MPRSRPHVLVVWDTGNRSHITRCSEEEVEDVLRSRRHDSRRRALSVVEGKPPKWAYFGQTRSSRFLVVIAEEVGGGVRPITCYPLDDPELTRYLAWRRTSKLR